MKLTTVWRNIGTGLWAPPRAVRAVAGWLTRPAR
jgi:hypothetical protein